MSFTTRNISATTASISASGTGCAVPTGGWANSRRLACALIALPLAAAAPDAPRAELTVSVEGLRNAHGNLLLCLTRSGEAGFLKCDKDPAKVARVVAATAGRSIGFEGLEPGEYSLLLVHDENRNGKLDTFMGIPREGFAFSRNPAMRMGPPHYRDVHFPVPAGASHQKLTVKYLL